MLIFAVAENPDSSGPDLASRSLFLCTLWKFLWRWRYYDEIRSRGLLKKEANDITGERVFEGFLEKDGKPYCSGDFYRLFAPKCAGCGGSVTEKYLTAANGTWHPECFVCAVSSSSSHIHSYLVIISLKSTLHSSIHGVGTVQILCYYTEVNYFLSTLYFFFQPQQMTTRYRKKMSVK